MPSLGARRSRTTASALGTLFFVFSLRYVIRSLRAVGRELRS
jgi:hypothetical protein